MTVLSKSIAAAAAIAVGTGVALVTLPSTPSCTIVASVPCALESSTNLLDWSPWTNGFTVTIAEPQRFWRGVLLTNFTLIWDASPAPGVTGYKVYLGTGSHNYSRVIDAGTNLTATVPALAPVTYYSVMAYGVNAESDFSNEVSTEVTRPALTITRN